MTAEPVWAFFMLAALALACVALPWFRPVVDAASGISRYATVDGLRGFLALGVFVFHLVVTRRFVETGVWREPDSRFYALLGPVGVSLFFMITGFLFWGKLLRQQGRPQWLALYVGRLFRIAPMYLVVVLVMLGIVAARTGWQLQDRAGTVAASVVHWLALGILNGEPDVNGYRATHVLAGVTWTIFYEWVFYASLLLLAPFARGRRHLRFVAGALLLCVAARTLLQLQFAGLAALFLYGMAVASLLHDGWIVRLQSAWSSVLALVCLALVFSGSHGGYGSLAGLLLAGLFYLVCCGSSLFGLLTSAPAQRLGAISYSLYLMQGLVLTLVFAAAPAGTTATGSSAAFWATGASSMLLLIVAAAAGYRWIERPGIRLGHRLLKPTAGPAAIDRRRSVSRVDENAVS